MESQRRTAKVLLLGEASVGKTSLRSRFVRQTFSSAYRATINSDFLTSKVTVDGEESSEEVMLQVWDTAGQERFACSLQQLFYRGADVAILVFDVTKGGTFNELKKWAGYVVQYSNNAQPKFIVAGNKTDLGEYAVISQRQIEEFADNWGAQLYMVSAKDNNNVDSLFKHAAQQALEGGYNTKDTRKMFEPVQIDTEMPSSSSRGNGSCC